ncbi:MAG: phage portal protein [Phycisphaerae bacterium]|nr:phage portal protein [Phycisphaerae bacterium]MDD5380137.1 phage portal protein [Phycisphaerae bacterium]
MGFDLSIFKDPQFESDYVEWLVDEQSADIQTHFSKLWEYYANRMIESDSSGISDKRASESGRCYVQAQEHGLPPRITGVVHSVNAGIFGARSIKDVQRKEVVIENDIAWRINAAVDFLFGKPISFISRAPDGLKRAEIESILKAVFEANGAIGFFQDMAVLGSVYGFVDCIVRPGSEILEQFTSSSSQTLPFNNVLQLAQTIGLELIEAPRALPVLEENDYKKIRYYVQHFYQKRNAINKKSSFLARLLLQGKRSGDSRETIAVTEIISATGWQRYENKQLAGEGELPWGFLPVVHIQNIAQPYYYEGLSDVEPLIPLQDELNTRLSDRASRITFQSFKMYLGKGIEGFEDRPVSPGMMWYTDNPEATIEEFGGDATTPSEDLHIAEIREAMDKASGVTPVVAGVLKNKLGNLTSAVALKLTLMGMLSKNERKRFSYSDGLKRICKMVLDILDGANIYRTDAADREIDIIFSNPLPEDTMEKLKEAEIKKELGVPTEQVLKELGY